MTVLITLTLAGSDTGPFDLYSDVDGFVVPFENNVPKASLVSGYTSSLVPNAAVVIRVKSDSVCTNYIDLIIGATTTTTTSTSTSTTTTTSTSTSTTTTTTSIYPCECVRLENTTEGDLNILITPCGGSELSQLVPASSVVTECVVTGSVEAPPPAGITVTYCPGVPETPPCSSEGDCSTCGAG
jgi:hypothetical protein